MFFSISTVFAENELKEVQVYDKIEVSEYEKNTEPVVADEVVSNAAIDTSEFTEDNVLYKAMQSKRQAKATGLKRFSAKKAAVQNTETVSTDEVTADFDIVLNFDMSSDMYDFDVNGDKEWLEDFKAISEQAPDNTRYAVVSSGTEGFTYDLEASIDDVESDNYTGGCDVVAMLDDSVAAFDDDSDNRNKVVIATTQTVEDADELEDKLDELRNDDVIPFVFVLNEETDNSLDIDGVYQCATDLELRLAVSDLYLSFAEYDEAVLNSSIYDEGSAVVGDGSSYNSDYRSDRHAFIFTTADSSVSFGMAITSILNIYRCLPLAASSTDSEANVTTYNLVHSGEADAVYNMLESFATGVTTGVNLNGELHNMFDFWYGLGGTLNNSIVSITRNNSNGNDGNKYIIGSEAQAKVIGSLKRRFPILLKIHDKSYIVYKYERVNDDITLYVKDYTDDSINTLSYGIQDNNWILSSESANHIGLNDTSEYNTMVFDMYSYINSYSSAYNITDKKIIENNNVTIKFDLGYLNKEISGIVQHNETNPPYYTNATYTNAETVQADNDVLISSVPVTFTSGQPDIYNASKRHKIKVYNDVSMNTWFYDYVMKATEKGIMTGYEDGTFKPYWINGQVESYGCVTRGEFIKTALYAAGFDDIKPYTEQAGVWAKNSLDKASDMKIITDCPSFDIEDLEPYKTYQNDLITRQEAARILYRLFIKKVDSVNVPTMVYEYKENANTIRNAKWTSQPFKDQDIINGLNSEDQEAARQMYLNGALDGSEEDGELYFNPDKKISRAEVSKIITKCLFDLDEDIRVIQASYEELDGNDAIGLRFEDDKASVTDILDENGTKQYFFAAPKTGYYYINHGSLDITVSDMNQRLIENHNNYEGTLSKDRNDLYNIRKGEVVYINASGNPSASINFSVEYYDDGGALVFAPDRSGTYIFDNNHESLRKENVVNLPNSEIADKSWIMSNTDLKPGKYVIFSSHNNETCYDHYYDPEDKSKEGSGVKIYIDALIHSYNGAKVTLNNAGYWASSGKFYKDENPDNDDEATIETEESWAAMQAFADYSEEAIKEKKIKSHSLGNDEIKYRAGHTYSPNTRVNNNIQLSFQNNQCWLSEGIETMYGDGYIKPTAESNVAFMVVELTVEGNENSYIDINIGALKKMGESISSSRYTNGAIGEGIFVPAEQIKGTTNSKPVNECELFYEIDDTSSYLPISVNNINTNYNARTLSEDGNFVTNGTPRIDHFDDVRYNYVENDMFNFNYNCQRYNVFEGWQLNDTMCYILGNFGVKNIYHIRIKNNSNKQKYFAYNATTASNYIAKIIARTENGVETVVGPVSRNENELVIPKPNATHQKEEVEMCRVPLSAQGITDIVLEVWSPTNVDGSLENRFLIRE